MPIANINGVDLNYEVAGQGEAVVFLHGYTGSMWDWANQIPVLSPHYKCVAFDLRGHGQSAALLREEEYSVKIFADDAFGLLKVLNIEKCCLLGHSLGGFIALDFALKHQDMLTSLVLVATSSGLPPMPENYAELRQKLDELACSQGMEAAFEYDAAHNPMRIAWFQKHPELREVVRQKMLMTSVDGYCYTWKAIAKSKTVTSRLPEIKVPTLIYWGEEDAAFREAAQILKEGIADSELVTIEGVGHSPHEEAPDLFNEKLLKFLAEINW